VSQETSKQNYFFHNFVKFPQTLIIFGTKVAPKSLKLYQVHSFSTPPDSRQHARPTMLNILT